MIRRSERPDTHYTVIRNSVLRDSRLSYRARGVLCALLSRPDNWTVRAEQLAVDGREGRDAIRSALRELRDYGYIRMERRRLADGTLFTEQVVYDEPVEECLFAPETGNQRTVHQPPVSQASLEVTVRSNEKKEISLPCDLFDTFWSAYPRKVGKGSARKAWDKATKSTSPTVIIEAAIKFAGSRAEQDIQFTPYPASWLNAERWTDDISHVASTDSDARRFKEALARVTQRTELQR